MKKKPKKKQLSMPKRLEDMTDFEKEVLRVVMTIPLGQVRSYRWVAAQAGRPSAWRAVASAVRKNPYPLLIPCHRVIKSDNQPGGYSQGAHLKKQLIKLEKKIRNMLQ